MEVVSLPATIDIEALLRPISEENPSGENLQYSGVYDEIREAQRADDDLSRGSWQQELKVADWRKVIQLATPALETQTKDLQIGAWLSEALVKQHGFAGMRDSLRMMSGLHDKFWETLFPEIDEGDLEARANALEFMDRRTARALKETALTNGDNLTYFKWEESKSFDIPENADALEYDQKNKVDELRQRAAEENRVTSEMWRKAKNQGNRAFYEGIFKTLDECWEEFKALDAVMDEKFGSQTPGLNSLKKSLDDVHTLVKQIVSEKRELEPDAVEAVETTDEEAATDGASVGGTAVATSGGALKNRQDALRRLTEVAEFFRQSEPHSPVSYLVQRAVKWGNMQLDDWLQEVIKDEATLGQVKEVLGVGSPPSGDGY